VFEMVKHLSDGKIKDNINIVMTSFETFQASFRKSSRFNRYYYHGLCILVICAGLTLFYSFFSGFPVKTKGNGIIILPIFFILLGVYGLIVLRKKFKYRTWNNNLPLEQNIELIQRCFRKYSTIKNVPAGNYYRFRYQKNWWRMMYIIHLFADKGFIAISVDAVDTHDGGFIDFGLSKKRKEKF
jgi:hypothetical protein